ncbi:AAA family ATPase [Caenibacillus caldisaponilyticus]|uniref:AAA family ATPase n=1 Tax=Caenibacillus caldisaponilyticus TaxID=1674942 RepID=UPI0009887C91|nr:AAA family ATPase [Caenibacillus caldisaponilyticus]
MIKAVFPFAVWKRRRGAYPLMLIGQKKGGEAVRITAVHIDRFGRFSDWTYSFTDRPFLIVYGPNEAGKSTLVAFIKCILFGFPRKAELSPYLGDGREDIGGSLTLSLSGIGTVKVVRHLRKNGGRAILYFENGDVADESRLADWLQGVDREIYEAVFCFDLDGLNGIERMKADELNRYLFSVGMAGSARIHELEKTLEKRAGELFKPGGRNPAANQTLAELKALSEQLKSWEAKLADYRKMKAALAERERTREQLERERAQLERDRRAFMRYKACEPLMIEYESAKKAQDELAAASRFPENGLERYERWRAQIVTLEAQKNEFDKRLEAIRADIAACGDDDPILARERDIRRLLKESADAESWRRELAALDETRRAEEAALADRLRRLNADPAALPMLKEADTGLDAKKALNDRHDEWERLAKTQEALELAVEETAAKIKALKEKCAELSREALPDEAFEEMKEKIMARAPERLEREREWLVREREALESERALARFFGRLKYGLSLSVAVLSVLLFLWLMARGAPFAWGIAAFGTVLAFVSWFSLRAVQRKFTADEKAKDLQRRWNELESHGRAVDFADLKARYEREENRRAQLKACEERLKEEQGQYQTLIQKLDRLEWEREKAKAALAAWCEQHRFPEIADPALLPDVFDLVENIQERLARLERIDRQIADRRARLAAFEAKVAACAEQLNDPAGDPFEWEKRLERALERREKRRRLEEAARELDNQRAALVEHIARYRRECRDLLKAAGVESEEDFFRLGKMKEANDAYRKQTEELLKQLRQMVPRADDLKACFDWLRSGRWQGVTEADVHARMAEAERHLKAVDREIADLKAAIRQMEENEAYDDLLHKFEEKRSLFNEQARAWAVYQTALVLLKETEEIYRENRLPTILTLAGEHLWRMTAGRYRMVYFSEADGFSVERRDGVWFKAAELSRGTKEQLYLALRLALASLFDDRVNLPFIVDDGFVNFDGERRARVLELLREWSGRHQILLLTCHRYRAEDMLELFHSNQNGVTTDDGLFVSDSLGRG